MTARIPHDVLRALDADASRDDVYAADYLDRLAARTWCADVQRDPIAAANAAVARTFNPYQTETES